MSENELLLSYSVLNDAYQSGLLKQIRGQPAANTAEVASIANPDETYVPIEANASDPKLFSYAMGQDPAILMAKVTTTPGTQPSSCKYTLAAPDASCGKAWKVLSRDIVLKYNGNEVATNPYGVAQVGNMLYIIDYDSRFIYPLGVNELNGLEAGDHELAFPPFDPNTIVPPETTGAGLLANAKGQAIIAVKNGTSTDLYALYTVADLIPYPPVYSDSIMIKVSIGAYGTLSYVAKVADLGRNAQELILLQNISGQPYLFIPALGGPQLAGSTNGGYSKLDKVALNASTLQKTTALKGDTFSTPTTPPTYDIRAIAGAQRTPASNDPVYILTGSMDANYNQKWKLYRTSSNDLFGLNDVTISQAESSRKLVQVAFGDGDPGNYWDIFYEQGNVLAGDRLWFLKGSPIYITSAESYGTPDKLFDTGYGEGKIGGDNVDSVAFVAETMRQAALGVSFKRGLRGVAPTLQLVEEEEK
jgi:hypothetical protein